MVTRLLQRLLSSLWVLTLVLDPALATLYGVKSPGVRGAWAHIPSLFDQEAVDVPGLVFSPGYRLRIHSPFLAQITRSIVDRKTYQFQKEIGHRGVLARGNDSELGVIQRMKDPVHPKTLQRWESAENAPSWNDVVFWAAALGVPLVRFLSGNEASHNASTPSQEQLFQNLESIATAKGLSRQTWADRLGITKNQLNLMLWRLSKNKAIGVDQVFRLIWGLGVDWEQALFYHLRKAFRIMAEENPTSGGRGLAGIEPGSNITGAPRLQGWLMRPLFQKREGPDYPEPHREGRREEIEGAKDMIEWALSALVGSPNDGLASKADGFREIRDELQNVSQIMEYIGPTLHSLRAEQKAHNSSQNEIGKSIMTTLSRLRRVAMDYHLPFGLALSDVPIAPARLGNSTPLHTPSPEEVAPRPIEPIQWEDIPSFATRYIVGLPETLNMAQMIKREAKRIYRQRLFGSDTENDLLVGRRVESKKLVLLVPAMANDAIRLFVFEHPQHKGWQKIPIEPVRYWNESTFTSTSLRFRAYLESVLNPRGITLGVPWPLREMLWSPDDIQEIVRYMVPGDFLQFQDRPGSPLSMEGKFIEGALARLIRIGYLVRVPGMRAVLMMTPEGFVPPRPVENPSLAHERLASS